MDIVIISEFCEDFLESDNDRFLWLARMIADSNNVELITSSFRHTTKSHRTETVEKQSFKTTFVDEPGYPRNVCFKRFQSHAAWGRNVAKYLKTRKKPDVVYCAVPSLTAPLATARYCERSGIRFVIDVQDLWPEAFQMVFNVPVLSKLAFAPFRRLADEIYSRADAVCGVSRTYVERALRVNRKGAEGHVVFLGTELATFDANVYSNPVAKPEGELWLGYCGTLGASYDLMVVIDALDLLKKQGVMPPKFIVLGDGERRAEFEQRARDKSVDCLFIGRLPYNQMCGWLAACDIAVNPIMHNAAQSIINKHGDYASAGLPVLNTQESPEYRNLVEEYRMGFNCENGNAEDLADKLRRLVESPELRREMGRGARRCAEERFDRKRSYTELIRQIVLI